VAPGGHLARRGELTPDDVRVGAELGLLELIKSGTTAFADMYFHVPEVAAAVEDAGLQARLGHGIVTVGKDGEAARARTRERASRSLASTMARPTGGSRRPLCPTR